jgi:isocitrate/isopropylmalate dehydrogenase
VSMMLDYLGEKTAAARIEAAVAGLLSTGRLPSTDAASGLNTAQVGTLVAQAVGGL